MINGKEWKDKDIEHKSTVYVTCSDLIALLNAHRPSEKVIIKNSFKCSICDIIF